MIPLIKQSWRDFWYSPESAKLQLRAGLGFLGTMLAQLDLDHLPTDARGWAMKLAAAGLVAVAMGHKAGDRNPPQVAPAP